MQRQGYRLSILYGRAIVPFVFFVRKTAAGMDDDGDVAAAVLHFLGGKDISEVVEAE